MHNHRSPEDQPITREDDSVELQASTTGNAERAGNGAEGARKKELLHKEVTKDVIDCFFIVYNKLGFGFLEKVYVGALALELQRRGRRVRREVFVPVYYDGVQMATYRIDFLTDDVVVCEVKSTRLLNPEDPRQLLNCLKATPLEVGLLLHFGPRPKFYRLVASDCFSRS